MRTIYIDSENHCHVKDDGTMTAAQTSFFDGKCDAFVEGYYYDIEKAAVYPFVTYSKLDAAQREYERQLLVKYQNKENSLISSYTEGVNSI